MDYKSLLNANELCAILGLNKNTYLMYLFTWGDMCPPPTCVCAGGGYNIKLGGKPRVYRFYDKDAVLAWQEFIRQHPCTAPFRQPATEVLDGELASLHRIAQDVGLDHAVLGTLLAEGLLPTPDRQQDGSPKYLFGPAKRKQIEGIATLCKRQGQKHKTKRR